MIEPSPITPIDPCLARGVLRSVEERDDGVRIVLSVPNTSYEIELRCDAKPSTPVGSRILGTIHAKAKRMDVVGTGGRYVEPVSGRPRRVQGRVVRVEDGEVVVNAGVPIHCTPTHPRQSAKDFHEDQLLSFDVLAGASFSPQE